MTNAKTMKRSQVKELCEQLGHKPEDVVEIRILANCLSVQRLSYNRDGTVSMDMFGPRTVESYHSIEEDGDLDVQTPDAAGP